MIYQKKDEIFKNTIPSRFQYFFKSPDISTGNSRNSRAKMIQNSCGILPFLDEKFDYYRERGVNRK